MPSSPSVLFIASHLGLSGSTERLRCCLDSLSQSGTRITLATPGGCRRDEFAELEVEIVHWRGELSPWQVPFVARRMQKLARAVEADLIYVLGAGLAPLGARLAGPYALELTGPVSSPIDHHPGHLQAVVHPCRTLEEGAVNRGGLPRDRMRMVPHQPAHPARLVPAFKRKGERRVGYAGALLDTSGVEVFLQAARKLIQRGEKAHFIVLGQGPAESRARRCALDLGLMDRVIFAAPAAPSTAEILATLDVFVDPRTAGSPGWLTHEALAMGLPCVITEVQGAFGLVEDHEDALLVPRNEPDALTGLLSDLLSDTDWARKLGKSARARARKRLAEQEGWGALLEELLADRAEV